MWRPQGRAKHEDLLPEPMSRPLKVAFLTRYSRNGASSRIRAMQYFPLLEAAGITPTLLPLHTAAYVTALNQGRRDWQEVVKAYARRLFDGARLQGFDAIWVEKELLPMLPYGLERLLLGRVPMVLDFDDAIFHNYDRSRHAWVRALLGDKIDALMRRAHTVTVGNAYLGQRARQAGARRVEFLPSVIDLGRYPAPGDQAPAAASEPGLLRIVWIGSPSTQPYLELVRRPLERLAARYRVRLDVIGAPAPQFAGLESRSLPWSEEAEFAQLSACDVGIMPLHDTPWEQGKCSFKLIQYMACGLPVVASAVGSNIDVVSPELGFLARSDDEWEQALAGLADSATLRTNMGRAGRAAVEQRYCTQVVGRQLATLLQQAALDGRAHLA